VILTILLRMLMALQGNERRNPLTLGEISPLGLSKLDSMLGSFLRVLGLSIAARIYKVYWCVDGQKISAHKRVESVKKR